MRRRWQAKLRAVKAELQQRLHDAAPGVGEYLRSVVLGHTRYYGVPDEWSGDRCLPSGGGRSFGGGCCAVAARGITCRGTACAA